MLWQESYWNSPYLRVPMRPWCYEKSPSKVPQASPLVSPAIYSPILFYSMLSSPVHPYFCHLPFSLLLSVPHPYSPPSMSRWFEGTDSQFQAGLTAQAALVAAAAEASRAATPSHISMGNISPGTALSHYSPSLPFIHIPKCPLIFKMPS